MANPYLGQIMQVGFNFAPRGWALCDGQLLPISQNSALFSLLGTTFGGDGRTTFGLPDLRGRIAKHPGNGPGLNPVSWGERGGAEGHTLSVSQLPAHHHAVRGKNVDGEDSDPSGRYFGKSSPEDLYVSPGSLSAMGATTNTGGNREFNIRNPLLGIYHCIALQGVFPSRS
jgi:microcystin-dependent protein